MYESESHLSSTPIELINCRQSLSFFSNTNIDQNSTEKLQNSSNLIMNQRKLDELLFENFAKEQKSNCTKNLDEKSLGILNTRNSLKKISDSNKKLKIIKIKLKNGIMSDDQWSESIKECESLKNEIKISFEDIKCNLLHLKNKTKKRNHLKKTRLKKLADLKMKHNYLIKRRTHLVNKIDSWIKEKQCEIDNIKEKENLSKDADIILSDVRTKRINAKKFLTSLKKLEQLRKVKVAVARVRGEVTPLEADEVFYNIIVKLTHQWKMLDKEYSLEEKGLKLMIKTDNEQKRIENAKNIFDDWELLLFGSKMSNTNNHLKMNMENFITLRMLWDRYTNAAHGSEIPIGWLMPSKSCSIWSKCIKINST